MGGGLMQLVAYGAQDIYLTGNPQITFFKVVYRRHTNFSMEAIQQTINGADTANGGSGTVTISRNGDLVHKVYVRCDQDTDQGISGDKLISEVELEIGGQRIDRHYEEWNQVWAELTTPNSKSDGYKYLTGGFNNVLVSAGGTSQQSIMVPLNFWFCRNPGLALPLIALQYHEVKIKFTWGTLANLGRATTLVAAPTCQVWCDYIYLDTDERRRFAQVSHEYLIEQLQRQETSAATTQSITLNFNHPVKELIWTNTSADITTQRAKLVLNGHDRLAEQDREYFQVRQPLDYHTSVPGFNIKETERPVMLSKPLVICSKRTGSDPDGTEDGTNMVSINSDTDETNTVIRIFANPGTNGAQELYSAGTNAAATLSSTLKVKVGDILNVFCSDADNTTGTGTPRHFTVQVTALATAGNITTITTSHDDLESGVDGNYDSADTDAISIVVTARAQDPQSNCSQLAKDINVYSFALKPEEHQPSGTCNFSRIDNAKLNFSSATGNTGAITVYAVNYNVLRIMSGMGGLAYSN